MTQFSQKVHQVVRDIPFGQVLTYGQVAKLAGKPRAARAVGTIMKNNQHSFLKANCRLTTPCHRVVAANLKLGGFNGGIDKKISLLKKEGWQINGLKLIK